MAALLQAALDVLAFFAFLGVMLWIMDKAIGPRR